MKIILRTDVENLGKVGDVVSVKAGYGRNYLLPQGMAMVASSGNLKVFELERKKLEAKMDALRSDANAILKKLEALDVIIKMRVGENDKLYGSVTSSLIGDAFADLGVDVDRRRILLDAPIRTLGEHEVRVRLFADVMAHVTIKVASEARHYDEEPEIVQNVTEENAGNGADNGADDAVTVEKSAE